MLSAFVACLNITLVQCTAPCESCDSVNVHSEDVGDVNAMLQSRHNTDVVSGRSQSFQERSPLPSLMHLSKSEVEIVLARFDEDVSWSDSYSNLRTMYCKGKANVPGCISLPNVGREGYVYLYHIVSRYDNLSQRTIFSHAQQPTAGYGGMKTGGGHMMPGVSFDEYMSGSPPGNKTNMFDDGVDFLFTGALHMSTLTHFMRKHYQKPQGITQRLPSRCPQLEFHDGWLLWPLGRTKQRLVGICNVSADKLPARLSEYWKELGVPRPDQDVLFFSQGARFAASRDRIHERPKEFYEKMLRFVSHSKDPCENYFNEWMWYYIIGKPQAAPCEWAEKTEAQ